MLSQVEFLNAAIDRASRGTLLHGIAHVSDPSDQIVEVLIQCMEWNVMTRQRSVPESELPEVHQAAVDLLELLKKNLPDKCGEASGWNFAKGSQHSAQGPRDRSGATLTTRAARGMSMLILN